MMQTPLRGSAAVVAIGVALLSAGLFGVIATGCSDEEEVVVNEVRTYTVRARVLTVPAESDPTSEFQLHHEHIPDFVGKDGNVVVSKSGVRGMKPMIMPFPLGPGVDVHELKIADMIEIEFVVNWSRKPAFYITDFVRLPEGTALNTRLIEPDEVDESDDDQESGDEQEPAGDG